MKLLTIGCGVAHCQEWRGERQAESRCVYVLYGLLAYLGYGLLISAAFALFDLSWSGLWVKLVAAGAGWLLMIAVIELLRRKSGS